MTWVISIVGWAWIGFGVWWFFRPAGIRRRFEKRYRKYARWILLAVFFAVAGVIYSAGRNVGGLLGRMLIVLAIVALIQGLMFARGKVSNAVLDWWASLSDTTYRLVAGGLFVLGCLMQWLSRVMGATP